MTKFDLASSCRVTTLRKLRSGLFHVKHWGARLTSISLLLAASLHSGNFAVDCFT
jgi:hypothetical protein